MAPWRARLQPGEGPFTIDEAVIWDYFRDRGGYQMFGQAVSRTFWLLGCRVQMFELRVIQACSGQPPTSLNLLDFELFPYTRVGSTTFPAGDPRLKDSAPRVGDADYDLRIIEFVLANVPDEFGGAGVNFASTYFGLITPTIAGTDNAGLLMMANVEMWGAPISRPAMDPDNPDVIYQRMQKGVLRHTISSGVTDQVPVSRFFRDVLMDALDLPADLRSRARADHLAQYCPGAPGWLCRPAQLPGTDLTYAFDWSYRRSSQGVTWRRVRPRAPMRDSARGLQRGHSMH